MMQKRILSIWFPRLAAERALRCQRGTICSPFAIAAEKRGMQILSSLSENAEREGLRPGQPLRDAQAICPELITRPADPPGDAAFLSCLRRWAERYSPWIAEERPDGLLINITGCAHLFGGENALLRQAEHDYAEMGLTARGAIADTLGAAWALSRFAGMAGQPVHCGNAIEQEARATRSRAAKKQWNRKPGTKPALASNTSAIAPPGKIREAIGPLPVSALRLPDETSLQLARLGLRTVDKLIDLPRASLARRFGQDVARRLDQAMGIQPEPVSPAHHEKPFAARLTLPEPIGLSKDILASIDRLLPPLCHRLRKAERGARKIKLEFRRVDNRNITAEIGFARPVDSEGTIRTLLALKVPGIDVGFGIDIVRLSAPVTEPVHFIQHKGHLDVAAEIGSNLAAGAEVKDLIARIGARTGLEAITRRHSANSNIPEKTSTVMAAAWSEPENGWKPPTNMRPAFLFPPEPVAAPDRPVPPKRFRWRRREFVNSSATGPERIAPEWWLDDPNWRSGTRDYWRMETTSGERLWLFYAHGGLNASGWFCQGDFG
ncbi:MAG: DNA polymerase Y family protein [Albidovulum sp.]|nr:DNA polymerase Y family protein [Albidovulum sp.]